MLLLLLLLLLLLEGCGLLLLLLRLLLELAGRLRCGPIRDGCAGDGAVAHRACLAWGALAHVGSHGLLGGAVGEGERKKGGGRRCGKKR